MSKVSVFTYAGAAAGIHGQSRAMPAAAKPSIPVALSMWVPPLVFVDMRVHCKWPLAYETSYGRTCGGRWPMRRKLEVLDIRLSGSHGSLHQHGLAPQ